MNPDLSARYQTADALLRDLDEFRKSKAAALTGIAAEKGGLLTEPEDDDLEFRPLGTSGELSRRELHPPPQTGQKGQYAFRLFRRSAVIMVLAVLLWSYWLKDMFAPVERIDLPNFVGSDYETITKNSRFQIDVQLYRSL
jgi:hypothetical protein